MTVSTTTTAVSAAGDGSTTDFTFTFEILAAEDLKVIVVTDSTGAESEKTLTTDYTVAGVGQVSGGTVTFVTAPASGETVHIKRGNMALTQPTNYTPNDPFPAETHENALDRMALQIQQINEKVGRAVVRSETDSASAQLPTNETLKGKTLAFNETTGAVEAGPSIADVDTVSGIAADIATLADIEDGTDATDAIQTVASISGDVTTVSGISSDVTNVSNNAASVSTVAGDSANISTVAGNISDVATVSSNITSVSTVASNISDVVTVANDLNEAISEVETVANDLNEAVSEIDTVATSISSVQTVGTNIANVNTVAGIDSDVTTVSGISGNVTTVAGISSDVTTVSGVSADVSTVSGVSANVTTVATDITNVNTVASNIADVNNFALTYRIAASAPTTSLDEGDLYFDTTLNQMFVYDGSAWVAVSPDLVGDTSPQLGGNLDLNGNDITGTGNISTTGTATFTKNASGEQRVQLSNNDTASSAAAAFVASNGTNEVRLMRAGTAYGGYGAFQSTDGAVYSDDSVLLMADNASGVIKFASGGNSETMRLDSNGRLGIATSSPLGKLSVEDSGTGSELVLSRETAVTNLYSRIGWTGSNGLDIGVDAGNVLSASHITMSVDSAERLRIDNNGNFVVGDTSAFATNAVTLAGAGYLYSRRTSGGPLTLRRDSTDGTLATFEKDGTTVGVIGTQNWGIGTASPVVPLQVKASSPAVSLQASASKTSGSRADFNAYNSDVSTVGYIRFGAVTDNVGTDIQFANRPAGGSLTERLRITSDGSVGINVTNPAATLDVNGTIKLDGNYPVGTQNVALGDAALDDGSLSGAANTAIGNVALSANTSGANNTAVGNASLVDNTTGARNTALGNVSLRTNSSGADNTAVGNGALYSNTTASNNTAVGYLALYDNTTGYNNTSLGYAALTNNTTGYNNTAIGREALENATTAAANTAIGVGSGSQITTGQNNTILGRYNGNQGGLDIRTSSNNIVLSDGDGNPRLRINSSGDLFVPRVYANTTGSSANMFVASDGQFLRSTSSQRYKNTINDATHGLTELLALRPVTYKGNNDGDTVFGGLIAEEVHDAGLTEFVQYNEDGEPDALAYGNMVSLCIKAIQEQQETITALEARIAALESN